MRYKYIRNQFGVYEVINREYVTLTDLKTGKKVKKFAGYNIKCPDYKGAIMPVIDPKSIVGKANSIDELCDEFVFFDNEKHPHYKSQEGNLWYLGAGLFQESLRACIFNEKGMIYVAKMGEGGWELL